MLSAMRPMRDSGRNLIIIALALFVTAVIASCDTITAVNPLGGKCHSRADGSVLTAVEDANGKQWPVVKYPTIEHHPGICGVSIDAMQAAYRTEYVGFVNLDRWWLHPETKDRIDAGAFGSYRGLVSIDTGRYEWY